LHGASWVDDDIPIELISSRARPQPGLLIRNEVMADDEITWACKLPVTEDVLVLAERYRGARGLKALRAALPLVDGGAASPQETWLRLLFVDAGLPKPTTQIPICDHRGRLIRMVDMGWEEFMVAAEYDGDQHRTSRPQYVKDIRVLPKLERMGWNVIRVIKEDRDEDVIARAWKALVSRGWRP
jgi:hypothetical protein